MLKLDNLHYWYYAQIGSVPKFLTVYLKNMIYKC